MAHQPPRYLSVATYIQQTRVGPTSRLRTVSGLRHTRRAEPLPDRLVVVVSVGARTVRRFFDRIDDHRFDLQAVLLEAPCGQCAPALRIDCRNGLPTGCCARCSRPARSQSGAAIAFACREPAALCCSTSAFQAKLVGDLANRAKVAAIRPIASLVEDPA